MAPVRHCFHGQHEPISKKKKYFVSGMEKSEKYIYSGFRKKARVLRGHPCKNQTKMKFLWQGSKIQIVSIFAHKQTLVRQERLCIFFHQICFYFREKRTFRFHPLESMDRVITGRKLNTFARFAFQRYYVQGNLTNVSSFIDSLPSVKCKLCRNWLKTKMEKQCALFRYKKMSVKKTSLFTMCHYSEFHKITYVNF